MNLSPQNEKKNIPCKNKRQIYNFFPGKVRRVTKMASSICVYRNVRYTMHRKLIIRYQYSMRCTKFLGISKDRIALYTIHRKFDTCELYSILSYRCTIHRKSEIPTYRSVRYDQSKIRKINQLFDNNNINKNPIVPIYRNCSIRYQNTLRN